MEKKLEEIYTNPSNASSFSGRNKLLKSLKNIVVNGKKIKRKDINKWLMKKDVYTTHKPVVRKFARSKILTKGMKDLYEADLMDMSNISKNNSKVNFVLLVIDAFSKELWVQTLKSKNAPEVLKAFKNIIKQSGKPKRLRTDKGTEFKNNIFSDYLKDIGVKHYFINNETKASIVERVIRTLKKKIYRYLTFKSTNKYIDVLQDLVDSYNKTFHKSIKKEPINVNKGNEMEIWKRLYLPTLTKVTKPALYKKGDKVRLSVEREAFPRGYYEGWTQEYFVIDKIIKSIPTRYLLKDILGEEVTGSFYEAELQKIDKPQDAEFVIEKILRRRGRGDNREVLIKWKYWPDKYNSWEPASSVKDI